MLRTVSAGPQIIRPGMVGLSTEAPITPAGMPSSSITSEMTPVQSPSLMNRSTAPASGFGVDCIRIRSAAIRPVSFFSAMSAAPALYERLVELNIGLADHRRQARGLVFDEGMEFGRRAADHVGALFDD